MFYWLKSFVTFFKFYISLCSEFDLCSANNGGCQHLCRRNSNGHASCSCNEGFHLHPNKRDCLGKLRKNNCPMIIVWDPYELFLHLPSSFKLFSLLRILRYKAESALEGAHSAGAIYPSFISMKRLRASLLPRLLYPESNALTIRALRHPHPEEYLGINPYTEREERVFLLKQSFFSFHSHRGSQKENKNQDGGGLALQIEGYQRSHC